MMSEEESQLLTKLSRRNALTPESHIIAPIKQTEVMEKLNSMSLMGPSTSRGEGDKTCMSD